MGLSNISDRKTSSATDRNFNSSNVGRRNRSAERIVDHIKQNNIPPWAIEARIISPDGKAGKVSLVKGENGQIGGITNNHVTGANEGNTGAILQLIDTRTQKPIGEAPVAVLPNIDNKLDLNGVKIPEALKPFLEGAKLPEIDNNKPQAISAKPEIKSVDDTLLEMKSIGEQSKRALETRLGISGPNNKLISSRNNNQAAGEVRLSKNQPVSGPYIAFTPSESNSNPKSHYKGASGGKVSKKVNGEEVLLGVVTLGSEQADSRGAHTVLAQNTKDPVVNKTIRNLAKAA